MSEAVECRDCDERLNRCWKCGHRGPWHIMRDCDHLAAQCGHCGVWFDIGWNPHGFDPDLIEEPA